MKKTFTVMAAILLAGTVIATAASAYAFDGEGKHFFQNEDMQNAMENGDYEAFRAAFSEEMGKHMTQERFAMMAERHGDMTAVREAIENKDYNAWKTAIEAAKPPSITEIITEENFDKFAQMHEAMQNGDPETAKTIAEELGLENHGMKGKGFGRAGGMRGGFGGNCPMQ